MDFKQRIELNKMNLRKAENAKIAAETDLKNAEQRIGEVEEEMKAQGVTPDNIQDEIAKLEKEIDEKLTSAERLIPQV